MHQSTNNFSYIILACVIQSKCVLHVARSQISRCTIFRFNHPSFRPFIRGRWNRQQYPLNITATCNLHAVSSIITSITGYVEERCSVLYQCNLRLISLHEVKLGHTEGEKFLQRCKTQRTVRRQFRNLRVWQWSLQDEERYECRSRLDNNVWI